MITPLLILVGVLLAAAYVLAPLLRSEADLKPFRRARPGTRHLHGLESIDVSVSDSDQRVCPHCGETVRADFDFCGSCALPLP
jgi:hypothetical protein